MTNNHKPPCGALMKAEQKIHDLEKRYDGDKDALGENLKDIWEAIKEIRDDLWKRLPLWASFLITALFATVVGLIVAFVKTPK